MPTRTPALDEEKLQLLFVNHVPFDFDFTLPDMAGKSVSLDDLEDLHAILSDPIAMRHYPKPFDREMTKGWIDWSLRNYEEHGFGLWAVIHREDANLIGHCGLTIQHVDGVGELEIGYTIMRSYWGRGLATEGAIACREKCTKN